MADYGAKVADEAIQATEKKLRETYATAEKELQKKLANFVSRHKVKDAAKRKLLAQGKITKEEYDEWKRRQIFTQERWEAKAREVAHVMTDSNRQATKIINEGRLNVFAENHNFMAYIGEQQLGVSFDIYSTESVARLIQEDPQVLPEWKIDEPKDYAWNYKKVNNIIQQGIIQGESIPDMAKRLCRDLAAQNENKMNMFARTAITGAQNAGRQSQMEQAAAMGIEVKKQWLATLDSRTRDWHRDRDGETVPYNEKFSGGLEFPGDPAGKAGDVFNCRCTMVTVYPKYAHLSTDRTRLAYDENDGKRKSYLTDSAEVFKGWSEKAYQRWSQRKHEQKAKESAHKTTTDFSGVSKEVADAYNNAINKMTEEYPLRNTDLSVADFRTAWNLPADTDLWDFTDENTEWQGVGAIFYGDKTQYPGGKAYNKPHIIMYNAEEHIETTMEEALSHMANIRERDGWKSNEDSFFNAAFGAEADIAHEYGHALANDTGLYYGGDHFDELDDIFRRHSAEEIGRDVSKYATTNCEELFAESFVLYHEPRLRTPIVNEVMGLFFKYRR